MVVLGTRERHCAAAQLVFVHDSWRSSPYQVRGCPPTVRVMLMPTRLVKASPHTEVVISEVRVQLTCAEQAGTLTVRDPDATAALPFHWTPVMLKTQS